MFVVIFFFVFSISRLTEVKSDSAGSFKCHLSPNSGKITLKRSLLNNLSDSNSSPESKKAKTNCDSVKNLIDLESDSSDCFSDGCENLSSNHFSSVEGANLQRGTQDSSLDQLVYCASSSNLPSHSINNNNKPSSMSAEFIEELNSLTKKVKLMMLHLKISC